MEYYLDGERVGNGSLWKSSIICRCSFDGVNDGTVWILFVNNCGADETCVIILNIDIKYLFYFLIILL